MKKLTILGTSFILILILSYSMTVHAFSGSGSGTEADPYIITNIEQLYSIRDGITNSYQLATDLDFTDPASYADANDISYGDINGNGAVEGILTELTTGGGWPAIPGIFSGSLNGNGHTIDHLYIDRTTNSAFFEQTYDYYNNHPLGVVRNISFTNVDVSSTAGAAILTLSHSYALITDVYLQGTLSADDSYSAGVAAATSNGGKIYNTVVNVTITNTGLNTNDSHVFVAGFVGYFYQGELRNCANLGSINNNRTGSYVYVGGLVGYSNGSARIYDSYNAGNVNSVDDGAGGIVGLMQANSQFYNVFNMGDVQGISQYGGLIGSSYRKSGSIMQDAFNLGNVGTAQETSTSVGDLYGIYYVYYSDLPTTINVYKFAFLEPTSIVTKDENYGTYATLSQIPMVLNNTLNSGQWDLSQIDNGLMPKLYRYNTTTILPNQTDKYLSDYGYFVSTSADAMLSATGDTVTITASFSQTLPSAPSITINSPEIVASTTMSATANPYQWSYDYTVGTTDSGQIEISITAPQVGGVDLEGGNNILINSYVVNYDLNITSASSVLATNSYTITADHEFRYYSLDNGTTWSDIGSNVTTHSLTSIADGNYTIKVKGVATNVSANSITLTVDTNQPDIHLTNSNPIISIDNLEKYTIVLKENGEVYAFGVNSNGQVGEGLSSVVSTATNITDTLDLNSGEKVVQIAAGRYHTLLLTNQNRLLGFGSNSNGQISPDLSLQVSVIGVTDVTATLGLQPGETIKFIEAGLDDSFVVTNTNRLIIFGNNYAGKLGNGTQTNVITPEDNTENLNLASGEEIIFIEAGFEHTGIITSNGRVIIWGDSYNGKLGTGSTSIDQLYPTDITANFNFDTAGGEVPLQMSFNDEASGLVTSTGRVFTWGDGYYYQNGNSSNVDQSLPVDITTNFSLEVGDKIIQIDVGYQHDIAISSTGRVFAWGENGYNAIGDSTSYDRSTPVETTSFYNLRSSDYVVGIAAQYHTTFVITNDGFLYANGFGSSSYGLLGDGGVASYVSTPKFIEAFVIPTTINIVLGSTYTDVGATCFDNIDSICNVIVGGDTVNVNTIGTYVITYDATDNAGNTATQVTRTVNVVETEPPVLTLIGAASITIDFGSLYTDAGATCLDNYDGDCTENIVIVNPVNSSVMGTYIVTYNYTDTSGNVASEITRTVIVEDTTAPVITLTGSNTIHVEYNGTYTELGATCSDNYDQTCTVSIAGDTIDNTTLGTYTVTYNVTDTKGNQATQVTRTVIVEDTTSPVITLTGSNTIHVEYNGTYTELGATCSDNYDQTCTVSIAGDTIDNTTLGTYTITYNVTDTNGNQATQVTRTIIVEDTTIPVLTLTGEVTIHHEFGTAYADLGVTCSDNYDGDCSENVQVTNNVNNTVLGTYTITYAITDSNGNIALNLTRTVIIEDTTAPVITIVGNPEMTLEVGSTYTEFAATCSDVYDSSCTVIVGGDVVDPATVGIYIVRYNVTDSNHNVATEVTRTINIVDTTIPVLTIVGDHEITIEMNSLYTDLGATCYDNYDTTCDVVVGGDVVDTSVIGTYTVTYNYTDTSGNVANTLTRIITVIDPTLPVITLNGESEITLIVGDLYTEDGGTCLDSRGESCTPLLTISGDSVDTSVVGTYVVTYNAQDTNGNVAIEITRTIIVIDNVAPIITLVGDTEVTLEVGTSYTESGAYCLDNYDELCVVSMGGDIVDSESIGTYVITFNVTDNNGNIATLVTRTVIIVDTTIPVITLTGESEISLERGNEYSDLGATCTDNYDTDCSITLDLSGLDNAVVGTYTITYTAIDSSGNEATVVTRTILVVDTTPPIIFGIVDGVIYKQGVVISFNEGTALLNNKPIPNNYSVIDDGTYTLVVTDMSGNMSTVTFDIAGDLFLGIPDNMTGYGIIGAGGISLVGLLYALLKSLLRK